MEFVRLKGFEGLSDPIVERGDAACLGFPQVRFEFGEALRDRVEVDCRAWQVVQGGAGCFDDRAHLVPLVGR
jgi:hypothetical protein